MTALGLTRLTLTPDAELAHAVFDYLQLRPTAGFQSVMGHLIATGIRVSHHRLRRVTRVVRSLLNQWNTRGQGNRPIFRRREYRVHGPMSMWHIDGT